MGLFPDGSTSTPSTSETSGNKTVGPSIKRSIGLFRSESTNNDKKTGTTTATNNIQQLSTSWEFIR